MPDTPQSQASKQADAKAAQDTATAAGSVAKADQIKATETKDAADEAREKAGKG